MVGWLIACQFVLFAIPVPVECVSIGFIDLFLLVGWQLVRWVYRFAMFGGWLVLFGWLAGWLVSLQVGWSLAWSVGQLAGWLVGWWVGWLVG